MSRLFANSENKITQHAWQTNVVTGTYHRGSDIVPLGKEEDDILAHSDGVVATVVNDHNYTNTTGSSYGNYIKIKHPNGYYTLYAHLKPNSIRVSVGETVKQGQIIATTGMTGRATGIHLHFEVFDTTNTKINPEPYIDNDLPNMSTNNSNTTTTNFNVGDIVFPINLVDYNGTKVVAYRTQYTITECKGNRAVLSTENGVWGAFNTNNLKLIQSNTPSQEPTPVEPTVDNSKEEEIQELKRQIDEMQNTIDTQTITINELMKKNEELILKLDRPTQAIEEPKYKATWNIESSGYYEVYCNAGEILHIR